MFGRYAEQNFQRDGISIKTTHHVERVEKVDLLELSGDVHWPLHCQGKMFVKEQGEGDHVVLVYMVCLNDLIVAVNFGLLVWSTGLAPNPLVSSITELAKDEKTSR